MKKPTKEFTCRQCSEKTKQRQTSQVFCSDSCRKNFHASIAQRTCTQCKLIHPTVSVSRLVCAPCLFFDLVKLERKSLSAAIEWLRDKGLCFYCGDYGGEIEHVIPRASHLPTYTVLACRECNGMASDKVCEGGIAEKLLYIRGRRKRRYLKVLAIPEWTPEEIAEMGYGMRATIMASQAARQMVSAQLSWDPFSLCDT